MGSTRMAKITVTGEDELGQYTYEHSEVVTNTTGTSIMLPSGVTSCAFSVLWTDGTYIVQATTDKKHIVEQYPSEVTWETFSLGELAENIHFSVSPSASAVRIITTGGTAEIKVIAR